MLFETMRGPYSVGMDIRISIEFSNEGEEGCIIILLPMGNRKIS